MEISLKNSLFLMWNRIFYFILIFSYSVNLLGVVGEKGSIGFSEWAQFVTIFGAILVLSLSYKCDFIHKNMCKFSYIMVYIVLANTTLFVYDNINSPMAMIFYGSMVFIFAYMYLDKWYLIGYQLLVIVSSFLIYNKIYDIAHALLGSLVQAMLLTYVTIFFYLKKKNDIDYINALNSTTQQRDFLLDSNSKLLELKHTFKEIADFAPYSIAVLDVNGRYLYVNHIAIINDQLRHWIMGKNDIEVCEYVGGNIEHAKLRVEAIQRAISTKNDVLLKDDMVEDGIKLPFTNTKKYVPVLDKEGEVIRVMIYA